MNMAVCDCLGPLVPIQAGQPHWHDSTFVWHGCMIKALGGAQRLAGGAVSVKSRFSGRSHAGNETRLRLLKSQGHSPRFG